jgi:hypothetical protein
MYCPVCGGQSTSGLNYCKRCGASLSPVTNETEAARPISKPFALLWPVALVSIVGLIAFFVSLVHLSHGGVDPRPLIAITAFAGATVLGVVGLLIWLLMQLSGIHRRPWQVEKDARPTGGSPQPQLQAPPISVPSVTENTTRNFDPARLRDRATSDQ